jgi:hypothetical protein
LGDSSAIPASAAVASVGGVLAVSQGAVPQAVSVGVGVGVAQLAVGEGNDGLERTRKIRHYHVRIHEKQPPSQAAVHPEQLFHEIYAKNSVRKQILRCFKRVLKQFLIVFYVF